MADQQEWLTTDDVATHYRTNVETVRYWRKCEIGPKGVKHGTQVIYHRNEIARHDAELQAAAGHTKKPRRLRAAG